jgi:hypothetical protein
MDRIDTFVNGLAKDILETKSADPKRLKLEIKSLVEKAALELQRQGIGREDSVRLAIERFGDNETLLGEIENIYDDSFAPKPEEAPTGARLRILIKGISAVHLVWGSVSGIAMLQLGLPALFGLRLPTVGTTIALWTTLLSTVLHIASGIGLWKLRRWGWVVATLTYMLILLSEINNLWVASGWTDEMLLFYVRGGFHIKALLAAALSIAGIWLFAWARIRRMFQPAIPLWRTLLVVLSGALAYLALSQSVMRWFVTWYS